MTSTVDTDFVTGSRNYVILSSGQTIMSAAAASISKEAQGHIHRGMAHTKFVLYAS